MKNNKVKKIIIISGSAILSLAVLFGVWGYGINIGARAERKELTAKLESVDNKIDYELSDFEGAWYQYTEQDENVIYKIGMPLVVLLEVDETDGEQVINLYSESASTYTGDKDKELDFDKRFVSSVLRNPTYYPEHRTLDFYMEHIRGSRGIVSTYFTVGQNAAVLKMGLKDSVNGVMKNSWFFRLPVKDGKPYIDIKDGEGSLEYARRKLGLPQDEL